MVLGRDGVKGNAWGNFDRLTIQSDQCMPFAVIGEQFLGEVSTTHCVLSVLNFNSILSSNNAPLLNGEQTPKMPRSENRV